MNTIGFDVPPEPPRMSVILDREDAAWQRYNEGWLRAGQFLIGGGAGWASLLITRGPVRVIYTPEDT
jgi:hypothetical protein